MGRPAYKFPRRARGIHAVKASDKPGWYFANARFGRKRKWRPWILAHLKGARPEGHPETVERGHTGHPKLRVGQVWVHVEGFLVTITGVSEDQKDVTYVFYKCPCSLPDTISVPSFRAYHKIWEDALAAQSRVLKNLAAFTADPSCRSFGIDSIEKAARFFGRDPKTGVGIG